MVGCTERFATIERENRILLSKMSEIMQKNTLDNKNKSIKYSHSLNKASRQRELRRITNENQVRHEPDGAHAHMPTHGCWLLRCLLSLFGRAARVERAICACVSVCVVAVGVVWCDSFHRPSCNAFNAASPSTTTTSGKRSAWRTSGI